MILDVITQLENIKELPTENGRHCASVGKAWCNAAAKPENDCNTCMLSNTNLPALIQLLKDNKELLQTHELITKG